MRAAIGSQCTLMNRGVTCIIFGSFKINLAAAFWVNIKYHMTIYVVSFMISVIKDVFDYYSKNIKTKGKKNNQETNKRKFQHLRVLSIYLNTAINMKESLTNILPCKGSLAPNKHKG